jgi:hypothetical protein
MGRHRGAAQNDRVARLQAQCRGVNRHVRTGLVDDRDHAERHPDLAHLETIGQPAAFDDLADGVRQGRDVAHLARHHG